MATQITRDFNLKLTNLRIGEENIAANAVTSRTVAAQQIAGYHIQAQSISSEHLKIEVKNALSYPNRNYIKFSDESKLSSNYLIAEYETTELIYDLDYTIVIYGMVNPGQQIVAAFNDGEDMSEPASFVDGYAVLYVHTPEILENTNIRFYNYPASTAVIASIGWVCMYRGHLDNPPKVWNMPPEESGIRMSEVKSNIVDLFTDVDSKTTIYYQTSQPTTGAIGDVWYDIDSSPVKICRWNGAEWIDITDDALSAALQAAADAQSTADGKIVTFAQDSPPSIASLGDLWVDTDDNNRLYRYNGTTWQSIQDGLLQSHSEAISSLSSVLESKITIYYQDSAPSNKSVGDIWYDTDADPVVVYRWTGSTWVDITTVTLSAALQAAGTAQAVADGKIRTFAQTAAPTGMTPSDEGDLWIDTGNNNKLYRYSGSEWVAVQDTHNDAILASHASTLSSLSSSLNTKTTIFYQPNQPVANVAGDVWYDTDSSPVAIYRWSGSTWVEITTSVLSAALSAAADAQATADGKIRTFAQNDAPTGMLTTDVGDLWVDTDNNNKLYRWNGTQWVSIQDGLITAHSSAISSLTTSIDGKTTIFYMPNAPTANVIGDIWYDTDASPVKIYRWTGTTWADITTVALDAALTAAADAQSTADGKIRTFAQDTAPTGMTASDVGDLWIDTDDYNKLYRYNGTQWVSVQDGLIQAHSTAISSLASDLNSKTTIFYQDTAPANKIIGDIWYDTDASPVVVYRWSGSSWVDITTTALSAALQAAGTAQATADGKIRTFAQTTAPGGMTANDVGDLWVDTDDNNKLYRWNGTQWVSIQDGLIAEHSSAISSITTSLDGKTTVFYQPNTPTANVTGDIWYDTDAVPVKIYRWTGSAWVDITTTALSAALTAASDAKSTADGKIRTFAQNSAPTGMTASDVGDLWIDTDDNNKLYRYSGSAWVAVQDTHNDAAIASHASTIASLSSSLSTKTTIYYQTNQPTANAVGDIWYDTDATPVKIYRWTGSAWTDITTTALNAALTAAADAHAVADGKIRTFAQSTAPTGMTSADIGDLWIDTDDNNKLYRYNGSSWVAVQDTHNDAVIASHASTLASLSSSLDTKTTIFYQANQPTAHSIGDIWYDVDASPVKIYRWDGNAWTDITTSALSAALTAAADAQSTADGKIRTFAQTSPPTGMTAGDVGDLWVDTDDNNKLYRWSGTQWVSVQDGNIASMASSILNIQNSLGSKTTIFYQMSAPTATAVGDIWYDIDASPVAIYRWNGSGWVDITTTALSRALAVAGTAQATADGKIRTFAQNEEPTGMTSGDVGDLWIDTSDNNKLYRYNGTAWEEMRDNSLDERLETAETTIDILGGEINAKVSKGYLSEVLRWEAGQGIILGRVSPDPEDTVIDMQLLNSVMNIRRNGVPVTWFGINGMSVVEGRVESSMNYGVYSQRVTADGGLAIG